MAYINELYYMTQYMGSDVDLSEFRKLAERASEMIDLLTHGKSASFSKEELPEAVKKAVAAQVEYLARHGGMKAYTGFPEGDIFKDTIGGYSYEKTGKTPVTIGGIPVSPLAVSYLDSEGLRCGLI